jgi:hypothetical protein
MKSRDMVKLRSHFGSSIKPLKVWPKQFRSAQRFMGPGDHIYVATEQQDRKIALAYRFRWLLAGDVFEVIAPALDEDYLAWRLYHGDDDVDGEEDGAQALDPPPVVENNWAGNLSERMARGGASGPRRDLPPPRPVPSVAQSQLPMRTLKALVSSMAETQETAGMALQAISRRGRSEGGEEDDGVEGLEAEVKKIAYPSRLRHLVQGRARSSSRPPCVCPWPLQTRRCRSATELLPRTPPPPAEVQRKRLYSLTLSRLCLAALDNDEWDTANPMVSAPDPLETILFAGEPDEMGRIAACRDAFFKLEAKRPPATPLPRWGAQAHDDGVEDQHGSMPKHAEWKATDPEAATPP